MLFRISSDGAETQNNTGRQTPQLRVFILSQLYLRLPPQPSEVGNSKERTGEELWKSGQGRILERKMYFKMTSNGWTE